MFPADLQFPHEAGEEEIGVLFDGHFEAGARLTETVQKDEAILLQDAPCLGAPVPGFTSQGCTETLATKDSPMVGYLAP